MRFVQLHNSNRLAIGLATMAMVTAHRLEQTVFMTQNDLTNGRLMSKVGIAPWCPAEFVILSICHMR